MVKMVCNSAEIGFCKRLNMWRIDRVLLLQGTKKRERHFPRHNLPYMITEDHSHEMLHVRHSHVHRHREQAFIGAKVGECGWTEGYLDVVIAELV